MKISDKSLTQRFDVAMTLLPCGKLKETKIRRNLSEWQNKPENKSNRFAGVNESMFNKQFCRMESDRV